MDRLIVASGGTRPKLTQAHQSLTTHPNTHTTPNTFKMREAVSLHMGQSGIQTGNACWELCACPPPPRQNPLDPFCKASSAGFS